MCESFLSGGVRVNQTGGNRGKFFSTGELFNMMEEKCQKTFIHEIQWN